MVNIPSHYYYHYIVQRNFYITQGYFNARVGSTNNGNEKGLDIADNDSLPCNDFIIDGPVFNTLK